MPRRMGARYEQQPTRLEMKKLLLTGVAALFLATGTAHANIFIAAAPQGRARLPSREPFPFRDRAAAARPLHLGGRALPRGAVRTCQALRRTRGGGQPSRRDAERAAPPGRCAYERRGRPRGHGCKAADVRYPTS